MQTRRFGSFRHMATVDGVDRAARRSASNAICRRVSSVESKSLFFGRNILVVEDEPIIALDIVSAFQDAGAFVSVATTLADATHLVEQDGLSAAVLNFGHDANELCARLRARGVPFVLHSGFGIMGDACVGGVVIPKPAATSDLIEAISSLLPRSN